MQTTKKGAFGFGAFIQTIRDFFTIQKLSCNAQLWTWREGAKEKEKGVRKGREEGKEKGGKGKEEGNKRRGEINGGIQ